VSTGSAADASLHAASQASVATIAQHCRHTASISVVCS
jgi:hypothetical protein